MWVLIAIAGLAVLIVLILSVPLEAVLRLDVLGRPRFNLRLAWLFGLVDREITGAGEKQKKKREEPPAVVRKPRKGRMRAGEVFAILRTRGLLPQVLRLITDIFRLPRFREFLADIRVGLGDPAETGLLFAFVGPASVMLNSMFPHRIRLEPTFADDVVVEGFFYGKVRLRPIQLAPPFLRFACSLPAIRVAKRLVCSRWKRRK